MVNPTFAPPPILSDSEEEGRIENHLVTSPHSEATGQPWSWGDVGSVNKASAAQAWGPEYDHQSTQKTLCIVAHTCNPSAGVTDMGGSLGLAGQPSLPGKSPGTESPYEKLRWMVLKRNTWGRSLASTCTYVCTTPHTNLPKGTV